MRKHLLLLYGRWYGKVLPIMREISKFSNDLETLCECVFFVSQSYQSFMMYWHCGIFFISTPKMQKIDKQKITWHNDHAIHLNLPLLIYTLTHNNNKTKLNIFPQYFICQPHCLVNMKHNKNRIEWILRGSNKKIYCWRTRASELAMMINAKRQKFIN